MAAPLINLWAHCHHLWWSPRAIFGEETAEGVQSLVIDVLAQPLVVGTNFLVYILV